MSCPPLFQPIRFLAACTLDRFCFSDIIFGVLPWGWSVCSVSTVFSLCVLMGVWST